MVEFTSCVLRWASVILIIAQCLIQYGRANAIQRTNPCIEFSNCIGSVNIPTTRIMTTLFSFNFFRLADGEFLTDICQELEESSICLNLLTSCRDQELPEAAHYQNSDFELALWVCANKVRFESNIDCWENPFLTEMSSCTGLEQFLQPVDCLVDKIENLLNCPTQARDLFQDLLSAAHTS